MERLNLNIPSEARASLRRLASHAKRREAEMARELLLRAIAEAEREELYRAAKAAQTPELRKRLREISAGMEELRGVSR
jgi:hypothetical protein